MSRKQSGTFSKRGDKTQTLTAKGVEIKAKIDGKVKVDRDGFGRIKNISAEKLTLKAEDPNKKTPWVFKLDTKRNESFKGQKIKDKY
jgi:hypothetical protein|tara:strand:+ start:4625 stop:4885 length:261 start_codon:yes stop_codon:yes gene_type:complete